METKRYSLLGNYGYICPMIFSEDLKEEFYIEPTDSYEEFVSEIKEKLGIEDISNTPIYFPYCNFYYGYMRNGRMCGTFKTPEEAFKALQRLKNMGKVGLAKTCPNV